MDSVRRRGATDKVKQDNAHGGLSVKVALRLHFLRKYHANDARVYDACQGDGHVWKAVREQFPVTSYWGTDLKAKSGRISIDSTRILSDGVSDNVVDIDTYGSCWDHWLNFLPNVKQPTTIFLTFGMIAMGGMPKRVRDFAGLAALKMPPVLLGKLWPYVTQSLLSAPRRFNLEIVECKGIQLTQNTQYFAFHVRPKEN